MPLYYFDRDENGRTAIDREGVELNDARAAEQQAVQAAFDIAKENTDTLSEIGITVRDHTGSIATIIVAFSLSRRSASL